MDLEYIRQYIATLPELARPHQDKLRGRDGTIRLMLGEAGSYLLTLRDGLVSTEQTNADADGPVDVTIRMSPGDFIKLTNGTLNVLMAVALGRIKVQGDMGLLVQLRSAFGV